MKNLIKNDDAVSVVVGAILILAVLVTFMSVVTSSWVPIYEGDAESDHSDDTHKAFMDIHKQIEMADEFSRSVSVDLGTKEMQFIQNSNSVGYLEVNESDGGLFVTSIVTSPPPESDVGMELSVTGMNNTEKYPITNFSFEFHQLDPKGSNKKLSEDFMIQLRTSTLNRWISMYVDPDIPNYKNMCIYVKYNYNSDEKWINSFDTTDNAFLPDLNNSNATGLISINLLSHKLNLTLIEPKNQNVSLNGVPYNTNTSIANDTATLHDIIQHYMRLPGDGTGGDYYIDYVQFSGVFEGDQHFTYNTTQSFAQTTTSGVTVTSFDNTTKFGGGTLTLSSDYNFMVDQSYVYDSGAVFLTQEDGSVFKVDPPIVASNNSDGNLSLSLNSVVLKGNYQASGNDVETLYTTLVGNVHDVNGNTDRIMIEKDMKPEYYQFWKSYFEEIRSFAEDNFVGINATLTNNTAQTSLVLTINDTTSTKNIDVSVKTKIIEIS